MGLMAEISQISGVPGLDDHAYSCSDIWWNSGNRVFILHPDIMLYIADNAAIGSRIYVRPDENQLRDGRCFMATKYVVKTSLQKSARTLGVRIDGKSIIVVNGLVEKILKKAARRAKLNGRKTIAPHDLE